MTIIFQSQERSTYCGPSCAQYILGELGVIRRQETLYRHIRKFKSRDRGRNRLKWSSSPDGLTYTLNWYRNKFQPPNEKCEFELFPYDGKKAVAGKMISALAKFKIPCINLIRGDFHWIVINNYQPPAPNIPEGFFINDPLQVGQEVFVNYNIWRIKMESSVNGGHWNGKFLAICDPIKNNEKAKKENPSKMPKSLMPKVSPGKFTGKEKPVQSVPLISAFHPGITIIPKPKPVLSFIKDPVGGKVNLIDESTASAYTEWWLSAGGFYNPEKFRLFIPTLRAGSPLLVQELGKQNFYYLVPLLGENNKIYAIMNIAAGNADFSEFTSSTDAKNSFAFTPLTDDQITRMVKKKYPSVNVKTGMSIHKTLVWKFCKQSLTEFQPFYMVTFGKRTLFIRFDKKIFTRLS